MSRIARCSDRPIRGRLFNVLLGAALAVVLIPTVAVVGWFGYAIITYEPGRSLVVYEKDGESFAAVPPGRWRDGWHGGCLHFRAEGGCPTGYLSRPGEPFETSCGSEPVEAGVAFLRPDGTWRESTMPECLVNRDGPQELSLQCWGAMDRYHAMRVSLPPGVRLKSGGVHHFK